MSASQLCPRKGWRKAPRPPSKQTNRHVSQWTQFRAICSSNALSQAALPPRTRVDQVKERLAQREGFISLLQNSASKRDAKSYLSRFALSKNKEQRAQPLAENIKNGQKTQDGWTLEKTGVNLGGLYAPAKAIEDSPVFTHLPLPDKELTEAVEPLHAAIVKIRQPQKLDDETLGGIGLTLNQLVRLGLNIVMALDCDPDAVSEELEEVTPEWYREQHEQAGRIIAAIGEHSTAGAMWLSDALSFSEPKNQIPSTVQIRGGVEVRSPKLLFPLLEAGIIPIVPAIAWTEDTVRRKRVHPDDVLLALTRGISGITAHTDSTNGPNGTAGGEHGTGGTLRHGAILDRIIILDPLGGIPSSERPDKAHVFINLEQEYDDVRQELQLAEGATTAVNDVLPEQQASVMGRSNPFTQFVEREFPAAASSSLHTHQVPISKSDPALVRHIKNLDVVERALRLLPSSSSALIITPDSAAISSQKPSLALKATGVRTRRQKNPLIHNLLTDKPMVSSSLPVSRFATPSHPTTTANPSTFIKRGIPLTIIPDPRKAPWRPPGPQGSSLSLTDPRVDIARLVHLIEDSFARKLDVQHYVDRVRDKLAGIIVAGEYEGGAILTWEQPPPRAEQGAGGSDAEKKARPPVPYLDKFAVLQRSQGSGGVADIVFKALVRTCFPNSPPAVDDRPQPPLIPGVGEGVVWRSRSNNPVNKWYFERSTGMWKLPGGQWTMFWTTEGIERDRERFWDYYEVCKGITPSWADNKRPD